MKIVIAEKPLSARKMPDMSVFDADMEKKNRIHCYYVMGLGKLGLGRKEEIAA